MLDGECTVSRGISPFLFAEISVLAREETVVGQQTAAVARREDDFVPAVVPAPVLDGAVETVVDEALGDGFLRQNVGVQAAGGRGAFVDMDAYDFPNLRADAVGSDDDVVLELRSVGEADLSGCGVDFDALVIHQQFDRCACSLLLRRRVQEHAVHILSMKHVVRMAPFLLIVSQIIHTDRLARLPIAVDQLAQVDAIALGNVHVPFPQPLHAVCRARNRCSHFSGVVCSFVDGDLVACSPQCDGYCYAADSSAYYCDVEGLPVRSGKSHCVGFVAGFDVKRK